MFSTVNHFETFQLGRVKLTVGFDTDYSQAKNTITKSDFSTSLYFEIELRLNTDLKS